MCAINGTTEKNIELIERMNSATRHRGPDGSRIWNDEHMTLGHNRLAIIDLTDRASQPMVDTSGRYHIVFNGEIYNYRELREELKPQYTFKTESDTEVLLASYVAWGEKMLERLEGIFAFGIWDSEKRELLLVRDHMGVKPLYYTHENQILTFSSELQGLLANGGKLNRTAVALFLEFQYVPSEHSFVEGVQKLPPGHLLRYRNGTIEIKCYFDHLHKKNTTSTASLYETIDSAVEHQLISERPVGVFLSGGFDSSIVLHHTRRHTEKTKTFSIGFDDVEEGGKYNADASLAEMTARHYGTEHTTFKLRNADVAEKLEHIYQVLDEPVSTSTSVSQFFLNQWVRESGVVVALGGDGGDELFGGYTRHRAIMASLLFQKLPHFIQEGISAIHPRGKKLQTPLYTPLHLELMATNDVAIQSILVNDLHTMQTARDFLDSKYADIPKGMHPLEVYMRVDRHTWLADHSLTRSDRTSMIHGIEFRVPLLDINVVEYADGLPARVKSDPFVGKKIIRETYKKHLPQHLYAQPKRGWLSPGAKWLRDPAINGVVRAILSSEYYNGLDGLFDWEKVEEMLEGHCSRGKYAFHPLWSILILQIWARKHNITW